MNDPFAPVDDELGWQYGRETGRRFSSFRATARRMRSA
jgi:hypothetical protein